MSISIFERNATIAEMAVEMDRRGAAIERLEAQLAAAEAKAARLETALEQARVWISDNLREGDIPGCTVLDEAAADLARLRAENEALRTERDNSRANSVSRGKKLLRLRNKIIEISDHIEHEGDRAYFGSTNHADELREIFLWLDGFKWDRVMAESDEDDLLSSVERLLARADAAEAKAARLETALGWFLNDDRFRVAVGGNPIVVERMLADARAALEAKP